MKPRPEWQLLFLLPELELAARAGHETVSAGQDGIAFVSVHDLRARAYLDWSPAARDLMVRFRDLWGGRIAPTLLMCRTDWFDRLGRRAEPYVAFRNLVAVGAVVSTRALGSEGWPSACSWSDSFDFHPAEISLDGSRLDWWTPAESHAMVPTEGLEFRRRPGTPIGELTHFDNELVRRLGSLWSRRYRHNKDVGLIRPVFRALEIAYSASAVRFKNYASVHEAGLGAILWISACEVLGKPAGEAVNKEKVQNLLMEHQWPKSSRLNHCRFKSGGKKPRRVNRVAKVYEELYNARNAFAHGNRLRPSVLHSNAVAGASLLGLASTVFRTALVAYMDRHWPEDEDTSITSWLDLMPANYALHLEGEHGWL